MFSKLSLCVLLTTFAVAFSADNISSTTEIPIPVPAKVNITVYYESLCKDSAAFITKQLYPLISDHKNKSLGHFVDNVTLIPFGKSTYNITHGNNGTMYTFDCHHGPEECMGNLYQACAIKHITEKMDLFKYVNCTMAKGYMEIGSNYSVGKKCAEELNLQDAIVAIETCVTSEEGNELLAHYGNLTLELTPPKLASVPTVVLNEKYTLSIQNEAVKDLKHAVCQQFPSSAYVSIPECIIAPSGAGTLTTSIFMLVAAMLLSRMY